MTTIAWWHCFAGIAGDMALGSLVDAGAELEAIERELALIPIGGWDIEAEPVLRAGLACTRVRVRVKETSVVRTHSHIVGLITEARLPDRARQRALNCFARLAEAEGRLHRRPPAQTYFHEVGSTDAIIDVVGTCVALELLGVDEVRASPVAQGSGQVRSSHGSLPLPVPAVVELLRGAPTYGTAFPVELTTPTGAALLAGLCSGYGPMPAMRVVSSGYGAGARELDGLPNALQVVVGAAAAKGGEGADSGQPLVLLECNVDDVTGEVLAATVARMLEDGAFDAWLTPVVGKKGRPGYVVSALVDPALAQRIRASMAEETGSLGVRVQALRRWATERRSEEVQVGGYPIRVKRGPSRIKAEHDDVARVARLLGLPLREVARMAEEEAYRRFRHLEGEAAPQGAGLAEIGEQGPTLPDDTA